MSFSLSSRGRPKIPDIAKLGTLGGLKKSPRKITNSSPLPNPNNQIVTQQQYVESLQATLSHQLADCDSDIQRFNVFKDLFGKVVERYSASNAIVAIKRGYDEVIEEIQKKIDEKSQKTKTQSSTEEKFNIEIEKQKEKLQMKREKNAELQKRLKFVIGEVQKEIDDRTDEFVAIQQKAMKLNSELKMKNILLIDLKENETSVLEGYNEVLAEKNSLLADIEKLKTNHVTLKNNLDEITEKLFHITTHEREVMNELTAEKNSLEAETNELSDLKKRFEQMKMEYARESKVLDDKNTEFDNNASYINQLKNALTKIQNRYV